MLKYKIENMNLQKKKKTNEFLLWATPQVIFFPNLLKNVKKKERERDDDILDDIFLKINNEQLV
jgi:hypothetical protein